MIILNMRKLMNISILLLLFLYGCSVQQSLKYNTNITSIIIKDYISEFSKINGKKPKAILISENVNSVISIQDLPYLASMAYLRESVQEEKNIGAGRFSNVLCIYYLDQISESNKMIFKNVPSKLQREPKLILKITMNGKEISIFDDGYPEWEPSFEIIYDLNSKNKIVNDYKQKIERIVNW